MTCEALVIGSLSGLALTGAVLFLQALTDKKKSEVRKVLQEEETRRRHTITTTTTATITN
jgi:hypothetical protein